MEYIKIYFIFHILEAIIVLGAVSDQLGIITILTPCKRHEDCSHLLSASSPAQCINTVCECDGTRMCKQQIQITVTKIGSKCEETQNCNIEHSECDDIEKVCTCSSGYVKSTDEKRCLLVADGIGGSCEESVQCLTRTGHSGCQNNKCVCQQHMHEYNGSCYPTVDLGGNCTHDGDCSLTLFSKCRDSKCSCPDMFIASEEPSQGRCLAVATPHNKECIENIQCTTTLGNGAVCSGGSCKCKELYQLKENINRCVRDKLLGDICSNHSDCHDPTSEISRLICVLGNCQCRPGYLEIEGYCINSSNNMRSNTGFITIVFVIVFSNYYFQF